MAPPKGSSQNLPSLGALCSFLVHSATVIPILYSTPPIELQETCSAVCRVFWAYHKDVNLVQDVVALECSNKTLECAFREESVTVHLIKEFFVIHSAGLVKKIVSKVVRSVLAKPDLKLELDPEKVLVQLEEEKPNTTITQSMVDKVISKRAATLMKYVNVVLSKFSSVSGKFPPELKDFVKILKYHLREKSSSYFYQLVGGWFFLRVVIPALVSPETSGMSPKQPLSLTSRRNLILVGKVLQCICNESVFSDKEPYMHVLRYDASVAVVNFRHVVDKLCTGPVSEAQDVHYDTKRGPLVSSCAQNLNIMFTNHIEVIERGVLEDTNGINEDFTLFNECQREMEELRTILGKNSVKGTEMQYKSNFESVDRRRNMFLRTQKTISDINHAMGFPDYEMPKSPSSRDSATSLLSSSDPSSLVSSADSSDTTCSILTDECASHRDNVDDRTLEEDIVETQMVMKIKHRSKTINLTVNKAVSLKSLMRQIGKKFSLKTAFRLCYEFGGKKHAIKDAEHWNTFLHGQGKRVNNGIYRYNLSIQLVK